MHFSLSFLGLLQCNVLCDFHTMPIALPSYPHWIRVFLAIVWGPHPDEDLPNFHWIEISPSYSHWKYKYPSFIFSFETPHEISHYTSNASNLDLPDTMALLDTRKISQVHIPHLCFWRIHPQNPHVSAGQLLRDLLPALLLQDAAHRSFGDVLHLEPGQGEPIATTKNGFSQRQGSKNHQERV